MSLTQAEHLFGGFHELGINDLLKAVFLARPRYLNYMTHGWLSSSTPMTTSISSIPLSIPPLGTVMVDFQVLITPMPKVDINPGGTPAHLPGVGEFVIKTGVTLSQVKFGSITLPGYLSFDVYAFCTPVVTNSSPGTGQIGINLNKVEIDGLPSGLLGGIISSLILLLLQGVFANVHIPFNTITAGAFGLILLVGPTAETDQFKVRGNAL